MTTKDIYVGNKYFKDEEVFVGMELVERTGVPDIMQFNVYEDSSGVAVLSGSQYNSGVGYSLERCFEVPEWRAKVTLIGDENKLGEVERRVLAAIEKSDAKFKGMFESIREVLRERFSSSSF